MKGKEIKLPEKEFFWDKDGNKRTAIRIRWWENPVGMTYRQISVLPNSKLPDTTINVSSLKNAGYYEADHKPVFFGHYWLKGKPLLESGNICCLDFSVADTDDDGGRLVAYSFDGESKLDEQKFTFVETCKKLKVN